jgi:hypothetical protein
MKITLSAHDHESVLAVIGPVDAVDVPLLNDHIMARLDQNQGDLLLDMRQAGPVTDVLMTALDAARTRAKHLRHRVVVVDTHDGATAKALRRRGMHFRIPVYLDLPAASAGLEADRTARTRRAVGGRVQPADAPGPTHEADPAPDRDADLDSDLGAVEQLTGAVQAGRALWGAAAEHPSGR